MRNIYFVYIILCTSLISCKNQSTRNIKYYRDSIENLAKTKNLRVDDNFELFLNVFSEDSIFQINRIVFPVKGKVLELGEGSEYVEIITERNNHSHMDFRTRRKENPDGYTISSKVSNSAATVEVRGIDNGIIIDYYFEKRDGKWMFISYTDSST